MMDHNLRYRQHLAGINSFNKHVYRAGKMAQQLGVISAFVEDLSLQSTHTR